MQTLPLSVEQRRVFHDYLTGEQYAFATTLMAILGYYYGTEYISSTEDGQPWTPDTLRLQVADDMGITIDDKVMDRIQAGIIALTDDRVLDDAVIFNNVATALFDLDVIVDEWDEPDPEELAWAMIEISLIRGDDEKSSQGLSQAISDDVMSYIQVVLNREGFSKTPQALSFVVLKEISEEDYSDDPTMFDTIFKEQENKVQQVNDIVNQNISALMQQVQSLPFSSRNNWFDSNKILQPDSE